MNSWLLVAVVVLLAVHGIPAFFKGGSGDPEILAAIGSTHAREYVQWSYAEPQLDSLETNLTVAWLRAHPEAIDEYSATLSWKNCDSRVNGLVSRNITPIIEVGEGTTHCLPKYKEDVADPNVIGRDLYLAYQYRFCRAAVRRYKHVVRMWQTENELNEAWLEGFAGQRRFAVTGAWHDWKFLTELLQTIVWAVKDEDPTAITTTNLHTDVSKHVHDLLFVRGFYVDAANDWQHLMDMISIDAYPNMYCSQPSRASMVGDRVAVLKKMFPDKLVFVMETGYPVNAPNVTIVPAANFSEENQAAWIQEAYESVVANGGDGFIYFNAVKSTGIPEPPGGYTEQDQQALEMLVKLTLDEHAIDFVKWLLHKGNFEYLRTRLPLIVSNVQLGWGLRRADGSDRPSFYMLKKLFQA